MESPGTEDRHGTARDVTLLALFALAWRAAMWAAMPRVLDTADAIHYLETARSFASGDFFAYEARIPVLYPALTAALHAFVPDLELAARLVSLAFSTAVVAPVYLIAQDLHGRKCALVSCATVVLWPFLADYGVRVAPGSTASFFWLLSVWLLARAVRAGGPWPVYAALSFFALHLARNEGTYLLLASPVFALALIGPGRRRDAVRLVPMVALLALLLAGYALFMRRAAGVFAISYPSTYMPEAHFAARGLLAQTALRFYGNVIPVMMGPVLMPLFGVGLFWPSEKRGRDLRFETVILLFCVAQYGLAVVNLSPAPRYLMSVFTAMSIWSARGAVMAGGHILRHTGRRTFAAAPALAIAATMLAGAFVTVAAHRFGGLPREPYEYKAAGRWMKENLEPGLIVSRKPQVGYYADMPSIGPDAAMALPEILDWARGIDARYLVVDERYSASIVPALKPLLDPAKAPPDLRLIRADLSPYPDGRVAVYEIPPPDGVAPEPEVAP